jgi:hypothetical protein
VSYIRSRSSSLINLVSVPAVKVLDVVSSQLRQAAWHPGVHLPGAHTARVPLLLLLLLPLLRAEAHTIKWMLQLAVLQLVPPT